MLTTILHSTFMHGAIPGLLSAAAGDYAAFRSWKSFHDVATYQWSTAAFRWLQGFLIGGIGALGYGAVV